MKTFKQIISEAGDWDIKKSHSVEYPTHSGKTKLTVSTTNHGKSHISVVSHGRHGYTTNQHILNVAKNLEGFQRDVYAAHHADDKEKLLDAVKKHGFSHHKWQHSKD